MLQQEMNFDQDNRDGQTSCKSEYQEAAHDNDYSSHCAGEKLFWGDARIQPTAGQRLALAIVSLLILFLTFLALIVLAISGALASNIAQGFAPVFGYMVLALFIAIIVMNVQFNRKHEQK
jgi:hypothetical protein